MFIRAPLFGHEICFVQIFVTLSVLLQPHKASQSRETRIVFTALMLFDWSINGGFAVYDC